MKLEMSEYVRPRTEVMMLASGTEILQASGGTGGGTEDFGETNGSWS